MKKRTIIIVIHIVFWLLTFLPYIDKSYYEFTDSDYLDIVIFEFFFLVLPFYLNYFLFSKLIFEKKKYINYSLTIVGFIALFFSFTMFFEEYWIYPDISYKWQYFIIIVDIILYMLISIFLKGISVWLFNREIEKEKIQAELNFLKIQINPHFLFNTLNNIYSLAYTKDNKTAPMISGLSKILHYMLYDCKENRVLLNNEIELLKNFIELHQLRFDENKNIDFYTEGINLNHKVAPLILVTFLENSFKHGDIDTNDKAWIHIECVVTDNIMYFKTSNSISYANQQGRDSKKNEQENKGIGYVNIKKQLKIHYPKMYDLQIEENDAEYIVNLKIDLSSDIQKKAHEI